MSIEVNDKNLGHATAYAYAKAGGYTGTEEEFEELLGNIATDLAEIENLTVTVTTLPAGSAATASYSDGVLALGIPKGDKGDTGTAATIAVGTVTTVAPTASATVTNTGTTGAAVFAFEIPRGDGVATVTKTGTSGNVDTYTITSDRGVTLGTFTVTNSNVSSVNGKTGAVVLDAGDITYDDTETYASGSTGESLTQLKSEINPQIIAYDIGSLVWEPHTISTEGIYANSTIRIASKSYVYITKGTKIKVNSGYVVRCASYSSVNFEDGINSFTFRELIKDFTTGDIVIPYSSYYRFAVGLSGSGAATVSDGALAFESADAVGLSIAGNYIANLLNEVNITKGISLTADGSIALNSKMCTTDFIPVVPNNLYYFAITPAETSTYTTAYTRVICYNQAKEFIGVLFKYALATAAAYLTDVNEIITVPQTAKYIQICYPAVGVSTVSFGCYGSFDQISRNEIYKSAQKINSLNTEKFAVKRNNPDMVQQMIAVAKSYQNQKSGGSYIMHYGTATPLSTTYQGDKAIDCSTFIGFVLRGIEFNESPYVVDYPPEELNPFDTTQFVANSAYLWSINPAKYEYDLYQDSNYPDYAEARRASQLAQMFAEQGRDLPLDKYMANIEAGDLLFFSLKDADGAWKQPNRYRHITHVALVVNVENAPQDATWDTTVYPYKHTYIDVSGGTGTDPVRIKVLEEATISETVYGLGSLSCVIRPDIGNITAAVFGGKRLVFNLNGTVTWEAAVT